MKNFNTLMTRIIIKNLLYFRKETGGGEGVEIVENRPFSDKSFMGGKYNKGQYTYKIYHVETKVIYHK